MIFIISIAYKGRRAQPRADGARETAGSLSRQTQTPPFLVGAEELLPTHRRRARKVCVLVAPAMDVRASMARDVQCKHVSNLHVILHNRHQQLGSHCIMLSEGAEKALPGARGLHDAPCSPG